MKKYSCVLLLLILAEFCTAQDVFIGGKKENRLLTWTDFKGDPDNNSSHYALTYWNLEYGFKNISLKGDTVKIGTLTVTLSFDENKSWIKPQKETERLLKHEQGHFDIGLICQREVIRELGKIVFLKNDFQQKVQAIFTSILNKYHDMGRQYDKETNHSINQASQDIWNVFFAKELNR